MSAPATTPWRRPSPAGATRRPTATTCCSGARPAWASPRPTRRNPNTRCSGRSSSRSPTSGGGRAQPASPRRRSRGGLGRHIEQRSPEGRARLVEQRLDRGREGIMLGGAEFDDLAALRLDGFARVFLLLHVQGALKRHRFRDGASHGALEIGGPGNEPRAGGGDRPRDGEMSGQRGEAGGFVYTVSHRGRKRSL